jgi:hypothetical protein
LPTAFDDLADAVCTGEREDAMDTKMTRRTVAGLLLTGLAFPAAKAGAAERVVVRARLNVNPTLAVLTDFDGQTFTAAVSSDVRVGSQGAARGFLRLAIGDRTIDYTAALGGVDLDDAGAPLRAWVLMRTRGSRGLQAQDYLLGSIAPEPAVADCLIYDFVGPNVADAAVRFDVPGRFEIVNE